VLLADGESVLVHAIGKFLRESGYIVLDAFSFQDALASGQGASGTNRSLDNRCA
jgi:hypothetical protein